MGDLRPARLSRLLRPRQIAFIGGAQVAGPIRACKRAGYAGNIWAVNPTRDAIEGIACVPSIDDLPSAPDAALVGLSPERSIEAVRMLARTNAGGAVVMSSGFAEIGQAGRELQAMLGTAAGDMPMLGPNCMGILNQFDGAAIWADDNHIERPDGPAAAIISQSGAMLIGITSVERALPLGYAISTGNQATIDMADCITAVLADERVRAIGLYLEGMGDGDALGRACWQALRQGVPVVALKGGDEAAGAVVAQSHTASMLVERHFWEAFCERFGLVEVSSPKALVETLKLLAVAGLPRGNRVSLISFSGGVNGLAATRAGPLGLSLPPPTEDNIAYLRALLPETVAIANPLDLNVPFRSASGISLEDREAITDAIATFARDVADQLVFLIDIPRADANGLDRAWRHAVLAMIDVFKLLGLPCTVGGILPEGLDLDIQRQLARQGVAPLLGFAETMEALSISAKLAANRARCMTADRPPRLFAGRITDRTRMLDEAASKIELRDSGLMTPAFEAVPLDQAAAAADRLGYPVTLKILSDSIVHKAAIGGVRLALGSSDEVRAAAAQMVEDIVQASDALSLTDVLVERMVDGSIAEVMIGVQCHPAMGLALLVGHGGKAVEEIGRFETLFLPLDRDELIRALDRLGLDSTQALIEAANAIARYAGANQHNLATLDVNPVILTRDGKAVAVDAVIVLSEDERA
ncbi:MAG: acetate--CoA ligase family protein [Geminicoccaceae bacterium]